MKGPEYLREECRAPLVERPQMHQIILSLLRWSGKQAGPNVEVPRWKIERSNPVASLEIVGEWWRHSDNTVRQPCKRFLSPICDRGNGGPHRGGSQSLMRRRFPKSSCTS